MARIQRAGGARRSGGSAHAFQIQEQKKRFALDSLKAQAHVARQTADGVAVETAALNLQRSGNQAIAHFRETFAALLHRRAGFLQRGAQADDSGHILRARAAAALLCAAVDEVRQHDSLADIEQPDALGAVEFVRGEGQHINVLILHVDRDVSGSLHRVGVEPHAAPAADFTDFPDGLQGADLIVCVHDRHQGGVLPNGGFHLLGPDNAIAVHFQIGDLEALLFKSGTGVQNSVVLKFGGDQVLLSLFGQQVRRAFDGPVVGFAAAGGEEDLVRIGVQAFRHVAPRRFQRSLGGLSNRIQARGVSIVCSIKRLHRLQNGGGNRRGGGVVRVNKAFGFRHGYHPFFILNSSGAGLCI